MLLEVRVDARCTRDSNRENFTDGKFRASRSNPRRSRLACETWTEQVTVASFRTRPNWHVFDHSTSLRVVFHPPARPALHFLRRMEGGRPLASSDGRARARDGSATRCWTHTRSATSPSHVRSICFAPHNEPRTCIFQPRRRGDMRLHPANYAFASAVGIASGYYIFKPSLEVRNAPCFWYVRDKSRRLTQERTLYAPEPLRIGALAKARDERSGIGQQAGETRIWLNCRKAAVAVTRLDQVHRRFPRSLPACQQ